MKKLDMRHRVMTTVINYLKSMSETLHINTATDIVRVKHLYKCEWCYNNLQHVVDQSKCILEQVVLREIKDTRHKRYLLHEIANLQF